MKGFERNNFGFVYLGQKMPEVSSEKLKDGILNGFQITQLINNHHFVDSVNETERKAWDSFVFVIKNFLDKHKSVNYIDLVNSIFENFRVISV